MSRKTFEVEAIKNYTNGILAAPNHVGKEMREGAILVLDHLLHRSGNYKGYRYLHQYELEAGITPGIDSTSGDDAAEWVIMDETRRFYF